jgi:hypothetical protein
MSLIYNGVELKHVIYNGSELDKVIHEGVTVFTRIPDPDPVFANNTPEQIQAAVRAGIASSLWNVGDKIPIKLQGTVGDYLSLNGTYYAYILGFDHNINVESSGEHNLHLQFGKTAAGTDICFYKIKWNDTNTNKGGWAGSKCRTAICPAFLQTMPSEWQEVITNCTKYTDNVGNGTTAASNVTATQDKIWTLASYELWGDVTDGGKNNNEKTYQKQYTYYVNGGSKVKYQHNNTSQKGVWYLRSPYRGNSVTICGVNASGNFNGYDGGTQRGFAPCFQIS